MSEFGLRESDESGIGESLESGGVNDLDCLGPTMAKCSSTRRSQSPVRLRKDKSSQRLRV